jgi:glutathione S-transferase
MYLDDRLDTEHSFLCGEKLTLADIVIFNEVTLYMEIMGLDTESEEIKERINLVKWLKTKMLNNLQVNDSYEKMKDALKKIKIKKPTL